MSVQFIELTPSGIISRNNGCNILIVQLRIILKSDLTVSVVDTKLLRLHENNRSFLVPGNDTIELLLFSFFSAGKDNVLSLGNSGKNPFVRLAREPNLTLDFFGMRSNLERRHPYLRKERLVSPVVHIVLVDEVLDIIVLVPVGVEDVTKRIEITGSLNDDRERSEVRELIHTERESVRIEIVLE